jgi:hypothetical protein
MALTKPKYVERVRGRGQQLGMDLDPKFIGMSMDDALDQLGDEVADAHVPLLQKDFTVAMVGGVADLSAVTDAVMSAIIVRSIRNVRGATDTAQWQRAPSRSRLADEKTPLGRIWFAIEDNKLYAMKDDGTTLPDDQSVTFNAHYSPTIGNVPSELINNLISIGVNQSGKPPKDPEVETP